MKSIIKVFLCKSKNGLCSKIAGDLLTIGEHYLEAEVDNFGNNLSDENSVLINVRDGIDLYIDTCDLELTHVKHIMNLN